MKVPLIAVLAVLLPCVRADVRTVCSYDRMLQISESVNEGDVEFCLTGTVVQASISSFMLSDGRRTVGINVTDLRLPSTGDEIVVRGHTDTDYTRAKTLYAEKIVLVSKRPPERPVDVDLSVSSCDERFYSRIRTSGSVLSVFRDDIDPRSVLMTVRAGSRTFNAAFPSGELDDRQLSRYLGARVRLTGLYLPHFPGHRIVGGRMVLMDDISQVEVLPGPAVDIYDVPPVDFARHTDPETVASQDRRKISGVVRAVWRNGVFLVRTKTGQDVQVSLAPNRSPPSCGENVEVSGFPETDLFRINLVNADFRSGKFPVDVDEEVVPVSADELLMDSDGRGRFAIKHHGEVIRVRGVVCGAGSMQGRIQLSCGKCVLPVDISACPQAGEALQLGMTVEATGVCIMESDVWRPNFILPHVRGVVLVPRRSGDIVVVGRPSWWSRERILWALAIVLLSLAGMTVWNRILNRIVISRSRVLAREQIARSVSEIKVSERTRLSVELHDSLSQNLAGVAFQVAAAHNALSGKDVQPAAERLDSAQRMLKSCRSELRNCLFDLRSDTLNEPDFEVAVRRTLERVAAGCHIAVRLCVRRSHLPDSTAHAVLSIVRELTSNAIVHGRAASVKVAGSEHGGRLFFSVTDDGCGFDPASVPGVAAGHFGLQGIRERIESLEGSVEIKSTEGSGTKVTVSIPLETIGKESGE